MAAGLHILGLSLARLGLAAVAIAFSIALLYGVLVFLIVAVQAVGAIGQ